MKLCEGVALGPNPGFGVLRGLWSLGLEEAQSGVNAWTSSIKALTYASKCLCIKVLTAVLLLCRLHCRGPCVWHH